MFLVLTISEIIIIVNLCELQIQKIQKKLKAVQYFSLEGAEINKRLQNLLLVSERRASSEVLSSPMLC